MSWTNETQHRDFNEGIPVLAVDGSVYCHRRRIRLFQTTVRKIVTVGHLRLCRLRCEETVVRRWRWRILVQNSTNFEVTAISTAFVALQARPCPHRWTLTYFDFHG